MSSKHDNEIADFDKPYEENEIGMSGIVWFTAGLLLLILITFGLMWALLRVMEDRAKETIDEKTPLARTEQEKLPVEPRLQAAPGFGVDGPNGRINLELKKPQSEYNELRQIWEDEWKNGKKVVSVDGKTTTVTVLPIDEAKKKLLEEAPAARTGEAAENALKEAQTFVSYSSSGRTRTDRRR